MNFKNIAKRLGQTVAKDDGVALLALAVAVGIAASVTVGVEVAKNLGATKERDRTVRVSQNVNRVKDALLAEAWRSGTGVMPCPANPTVTGATFGQATAATGVRCNTSRGIVPFNSIGISKQAARDAYGNYFTYVVDSVNASACDGTTTRKGDLEDTDGDDEYLFALISHGPNGAGAYRRNATDNGAIQNAAAMSTREADNCPRDGSDCSVSDDDEVRSGPFDDINTATYFDDAIRLVRASELDSTGRNCVTTQDPEEKEPEGIAGVNGTRERARLLTRSASSDANNTRSVSYGTSVDDDPQLRFYSDPDVPTASCAWSELALPIRNSTVRAFMEYAARTDSGDSRGNGGVLAFMSTDTDTYTISTDTCGGTDEYMGFADDDAIVGRRLPDVPRLGVEMDTSSHYNAAPLPPNVNKDPDAATGHVAILNRNTDHIGNDPTEDSPVCISGESPALGETVPGTLEGCLPGLNLEVGNNTPTAGDFHKLRVELHYDDAACGGGGSDEILVKVWNYLSDGTTDAVCPADCTDLTTDYGEAANLEYCVPWSADAADNYARFGVTSGKPAGGGGIRDQFTMETLSVLSAPDDTSARPNATTTATSLEITNLLLVNEAGDPTATGNNVNSLLPQIVLDDTASAGGLTLFPRKGTFTLNYDTTVPGQSRPLYTDAAIGIAGIGTSNTIDNYWTGSGGLGYFPLYDHPLEREGVTAEFNNSYERVTINLSYFSDVTLPAPDSADKPERVRVLSYQGDELYLDQRIEACPQNTANSHHMTMSLDFSGHPVDRIVIVPETIKTELDRTTGLGDPDNPVAQTYRSTFYLRGLKACGADNSCGLFLDQDCYSYAGDYPYGGLGTPTVSQSATITQEYLNTTFNSGAVEEIRFNTNGASPWIHLENGTTGELNMDVFASGVTGDVYIRDDSNAFEEGFGVDNQNLDSANNERLDFRFMHVWREVAIAFGRFDRVNNSPPHYEQVQVQGYRNGRKVGAAQTLQGCDLNNNNAVAEFELEFPSDIDQLRVTAIGASNGTSNTSTVVHAISTCDASVGACQTDDWAGRDCTATVVIN